MKQTSILAVITLGTLLATGVVAAEVSSPKLNPQPEPPAPTDSLKAKKKVTPPATAKGINPQPEPPGMKKVGKPTVGAKNRLDPQPEPPLPKKSGKPKLGEKSGLNPQPEPPAQVPKVAPAVK